MVARIITGKSLKGVLNYNEHKLREGKAELLLAHRYLQAPHALGFHEKLARFAQLIEKSPQVKTNAVHISLNFAIGEKLEIEKLQDIATTYMDKIGFGRQPYLVYHHLDAAHPHLHIVTTNIQPGGNRIDLHNIGRDKSEPARKAVEQAFGLVKAEEQKQVTALPFKPIRLEAALYGKSETKRSISGIVTAVTRDYNYTSLEELNAILRTFRVTADRGREHTQMHRKKGLVYSMLDERGTKLGIPIKASSLPGKQTMAHLAKRYEQNKQVRKLYREALRKRIDHAFSTQGTINRDSFVQLLQKYHIHVLFRENKQGITYGITFIDHQRKAVFNGSELGKPYAAKALLLRWGEASKPALPKDQPLFHKASNLLPAPAMAPNPADSTDASLVSGLLQAGQQGEYMPLLPTRKKRKKKRPRL